MYWANMIMEGDKNRRASSVIMLAYLENIRDKTIMGRSGTTPSGMIIECDKNRRASSNIRDTIAETNNPRPLPDVSVSGGVQCLAPPVRSEHSRLLEHERGLVIKEEAHAPHQCPDAMAMDTYFGCQVEGRQLCRHWLQTGSRRKTKKYFISEPYLIDRDWNVLYPTLSA